MLPYDLASGGTLFTFAGHGDVKELALFVMDTISWKNWSFNLGLFGDTYNGISRAWARRINLFHGDRFGCLEFTVINLTDKVALYNFLSTFSGAHYVTPRTESIALGFHF